MAAKTDASTTGGATTNGAVQTSGGSTGAVAGASPTSLPELEIRELDVRRSGEVHAVREFCLNVLMQRVRLSNTFVYRSPQWLSLYILALAWSVHRLRPHATHDWGRWLFLAAAISALFLVGVDYFTYRHYERLTKLDHDSDAFLRNPAEVVADGKGRNRCVVAYFAGNLVGTCLVRRAGGKTKSAPAAAEAELSHWNVKARYRNKGLGGDLLHDALRHCQQQEGVSTVTARTTSIQKRAARTLKEEGFKLVEAKPVENVYFRFVGVKEQLWRLDLSTWTPSADDE